MKRTGSTVRRAPPLRRPRRPPGLDVIGAWSVRYHRAQLERAGDVQALIGSLAVSQSRGFADTQIEGGGLDAHANGHAGTDLPLSQGQVP
jgi:hypothetical protein